MTARLIAGAWSDAFDAADWYERQAIGLGDRSLLAIDQLVDVLALQPRLFARVSRPVRGREIREAPVSGFPFVATYEILGTDVVILSVTHGRSIRQAWRRRWPAPPAT